MTEEIKNLDEPKNPLIARPESKKVSRPFSKIAVELDPDDLNSKGVQKLILSQIEHLEAEVSRLKEFENDFHVKDKECTALQTKQKKDTMLEILYSLAITIGGCLIGWLPSSSNTNATYAILGMAISLLIFAFLAKWKGES